MRVVIAAMNIGDEGVDTVVAAVQSNPTLTALDLRGIRRPPSFFSASML